MCIERLKQNLNQHKNRLEFFKSKQIQYKNFEMINSLIHQNITHIQKSINELEKMIQNISKKHNNNNNNNNTNIT